MRKRNWRHTTEDNHSTLSNWQVNVTSWVTRNGVTYNNFSKCKLFIFRKHENIIVRFWKVLQELCMQYIKLAKLKIPDPVKWHNYVLWTYRIIKFQWWHSEPKGTIYTRSDEGRFLLPTQHSIIQWLWVVTTTCLEGEMFYVAETHRSSFPAFPITFNPRNFFIWRLSFSNFFILSKILTDQNLRLFTHFTSKNRSIICNFIFDFINCKE